MFMEQRGPFECVEMLVQAGAEVRVKHNNTTLLHIAAASGHPEMLTLLLNAAPELEKQLAAMKRRYWFNKALNLLFLLLVLRILYALLG